MRGVVPVTTPQTGCAPVDPAWTSLPDNPCFHATLSATKAVTLRWRVKNAGTEVYIYDDTGTNFRDIGYLPARCPAQPLEACSTTVPVTGEGDFYRWLLRVEDAHGNRVHVPTELHVNRAASAIQVSGGGFVDALAPTDRYLHWRRIDGDSTAVPVSARSWVELRKPQSLVWSRLEGSDDSGASGVVHVPGSMLRQPGNVTYRFRECHTSDDDAPFCQAPMTANLKVGSDRFLNPNTLNAAPGEDIELQFTTRAGNERRLISSTLLPHTGDSGYLATTKDSFTVAGDRLTPGRHTIGLRSCLHGTTICSAPEILNIEVDAPVSWDYGRPYREDFREATAYPVHGAGLPLAITYGPSGGIWLINEFSTSIEHIAPTGALDSLTLPLGRYPGTDPSRQTATRPFATTLLGNSYFPASYSTLAERATRIGSTLWFTQGGEAMPTQVSNHSRVISMDLTLSDSLSTPYDDRFCVYNVPTDDENSHGNNAIIGLTAAAGRIWVAESRGLWGNDASVISSFVPDPANCDNLLVFENTEALATQPLQYCRSDSSPERDACMGRRALDDLPPGLKVAQLATDPVDDAVWFTDAHGRYLGRLDTSDGRSVQMYPLRVVHAELGLFAGFTWSLEVDDEAVYVAEYQTRHILRFDKATATFHEIEVPGATAQVNLHSLDIDRDSNRLWFTLSNDAMFPADTDASTIGYLDLDGWSAYVNNPGGNAPVEGVVYSGLGAPGATSQLHQNFTGIALDPATGSIALACFFRRQIVELTPKKRFRP